MAPRLGFERWWSILRLIPLRLPDDMDEDHKKRWISLASTTGEIQTGYQLDIKLGNLVSSNIPDICKEFTVKRNHNP
jgi:hypothetical protein